MALHFLSLFNSLHNARILLFIAEGHLHKREFEKSLWVIEHW